MAIRLGQIMISMMQDVGGKSFLVLTDNTTTEAAIEKKKSGDRAVNREGRKIQKLLFCLHTDIAAHRVNSGDNLADLLSRGKDKLNAGNCVWIEIPLDLCAIVKQVV